MFTVVHNPLQEARMHNNQNGAAQQRELRFNDEEIWGQLPEPVRERCRTLWKELLASVFKSHEERTDERQD